MAGPFAFVVGCNVFERVPGFQHPSAEYRLLRHAVG
jgi:hypothetical protein